MKIKNFLIISILFLIYFSGNSHGETHKVKGLSKLNFVYSAISGSQAVPWIAKEANIFDKYGLDVKLIYIGSGSKVIQAMLAKDVELSQTGGPSVISANVAGADFVMVAGGNTELVFSLYVKPFIKNIKDLKGETIGVTRFGSNTDFAARLLLKNLGLQPDRDIAIIQTGGLPETLAAINTGRVSGGIISAPTTLKAKKLGLKELYDIGGYNIPFPGNIIVAERSYVKNNEDIIRKFVKAFTEGIYVYKTNRSLSIRVLAKYTKTNDMEVIDETYNVYPKYMKESPYPTIEGIKTVLDDFAKINPKAKAFKPEDFVDMRFVKELVESGFTRQLYKK